MDSEVLDGIREKLRRADEHFVTLDHEIGVYFDSEPHAYWTDPDYDAGRYSIRVTIKTPPPIRLGVICGDYIHCLRSVLDHLVCAHVPNITKRTAFPLYKDKAKFFSGVISPAWKGGESPLTGLDPEGALFALIQSVQPYKGTHGYAHHPLWLLGELSNADKHRAILARAAAHRQMEAGSLRFGGTDIAYIGSAELIYDQPLVDRAEVLRGSIEVTGPNPDVKVQGHFPVEVAFGEELVVAEGLRDLRNAVREVAEKVLALSGLKLDPAPST
jgi:hypothetical protein